jgi:hypothetical protein
VRGDGNRGGDNNGGRGDWNRGGDNNGGRGDWNRGDNNGGRGDWNRGGDNNGGRGDWNRGDNNGGRGDWNRGDNNGRDRGANNDRGGRGDWNRGDNDRRDGDRRGGRGWDDNGRRGWADNDNNRRDWDNRRHDARYRPYWNSHRDFGRPRYSDWRGVRHGYYFDSGYASILHGYYGRNYYWWSYGGWHRPYRDYRVGYLIPSYIYWEPVPWDLYYRLPPAPYGCRYVYVDGDILLIAIASGIILDALLYY